MSLKLAARLVNLAPYKIADLKENDTAVHDLDLSPFVPPETKAIIFHAKQISGTGRFKCFPNSGSTHFINADTLSVITTYVFQIKDQILKWQNTIANDDWDIILFGYFVQKRTR